MAYEAAHLLPMEPLCRDEKVSAERAEKGEIEGKAHQLSSSLSVSTLTQVVVDEQKRKMRPQLVLDEVL